MGKFSQSFPSVLMPGYQVITILVALLVTIAVTASKAEEHKINTLYGRKLHGDSQLLRDIFAEELLHRKFKSIRNKIDHSSATRNINATGQITSRRRQSNTTPSQWRQCVQQSNCCNRKVAFCIGCNGGCLRQDILQKTPFSQAIQLEDQFPRWMAELPNSLKLSQMSIPGTHDSGAFKPNVAGLAKTQTLSIYNQLQAGIRMLDIRCRHIRDSFTIHHGPVYLDLIFADVLNDVTRFLATNKGEVVLMRIKEEHEPSENTRTFADTLRTYINDPKYSPYFWREETLPTLGTGRGKIIILDNTPGQPGFGPKWDELKMQDEYMLPGNLFTPLGQRINQKWAKAKKFFEETDKGALDRVHINFLSAAAFGFGILLTSPSDIAGGQGNAKGMNQLAFEYLNPEGSVNNRAGWVYMDYPGISLIYSVLIRN